MRGRVLGIGFWVLGFRALVLLSSGVETQRTRRTTKTHKGGLLTTAAQRPQRATTFGFLLPTIYELSSASELPHERGSATSGRFTIYASGWPA